eukprot:scaffold4626_cov108-Isochrysis_galbana.AAC.1
MCLNLASLDPRIRRTYHGLGCLEGTLRQSNQDDVAAWPLHSHLLRLSLLHFLAQSAQRLQRGARRDQPLGGFDCRRPPAREGEHPPVADGNRLDPGGGGFGGVVQLEEDAHAQEATGRVVDQTRWRHAATRAPGRSGGGRGCCGFSRATGSAGAGARPGAACDPTCDRCHRLLWHCGRCAVLKKKCEDSVWHRQRRGASSARVLILDAKQVQKQRCVGGCKRVRRLVPESLHEGAHHHERAAERRRAQGAEDAA